MSQSVGFLAELAGALWAVVADAVSIVLGGLIAAVAVGLFALNRVVAAGSGK